MLQGFIQMLETYDKLITVSLVIPRPWLHNHAIVEKGLQMLASKPSRRLLMSSGVCFTILSSNHPL